MMKMQIDQTMIWTVMILAHVDCNDNDPTSYNIQIDADCDGTLTPDDCDDSTESTIIAEDGDCDGIVSELDCDDNDSTSTIAIDADCDTDPTVSDCDDTDPILHTLDIDGDIGQVVKEIVVTWIGRFDLMVTKDQMMVSIKIVLLVI